MRVMGLTGALCALLVAQPLFAQGWTEYVNKPLKLAPLPSSAFAEVLAEDLRVNLDFEIDRQSSDGSWEPNWSWRGAYPAEWQIARHEWCGELTLKTLRSLRAYGRIEGR